MSESCPFLSRKLPRCSINRSCLDFGQDLRGGLDGLQARMQNNKAVVALAAKMARLAWVILNTWPLYERRAACAEVKAARSLIARTDKVIAKRSTSVSPVQKSGLFAPTS